MIRLQIEVSGQRREFSSRASAIFLGRGNDPDENFHIYLTDEALSRVHGQIELRDGEYVYRDLLSDIGTAIRRGGPTILLGKDQTRSEQRLKTGDEILLGGSKITVEEIKVQSISLLKEVGGEIQEQVSTFRELGEFETLEKSLKGDEKALAAIYTLETQFATLDLDELLENILEMLLQVFSGANNAFLVVRVKGTDRFQFRLGKRRGEDSPPSLKGMVSHSIFRRVLSEGHAILIENPMETISNSDSVVTSGIKSGMCAPLWRGKEIMGMIQVDNRRMPGCFGHRDLHLLTVFANRAASAIAQAELDREKKAAELNAELGKKVRSIAHEAGNVLGPMFQGLELIEERLRSLDVSDTSIDTIMELLRKDSARMRTFLADLQDPAQAERPLTLEATDPNFLAKDVHESMAKAMERRGKEFRLELAENTPPIRADSEKLRQVLLNLIRNSQEATKRGDWVAMRTSYEGNGVTFEVADNGCGIPADLMESIFDPFSSTKSRGTGLGLSVASGIVEKHRGKISVESKEGNGSIFYVTIPAMG